jgi:hypothetical protein
MVMDMGAVAINPAAAPLRSVRKEKFDPKVFINPGIYAEIYRLPACRSMREAPMVSTGITYKVMI